MSLYQDPTVPGRIRPNLMAELLGQPAWDQHHQLENQASIVLAWLIDRSPEVARRLIDLWLEDPELPTGAVIGVRDQVILPSKLRPDISIEVSQHSLQLLIEVKVSAELAEHNEKRQDEAYRREWQQMPAAGEAERRAVGTLTRDPEAYDLPDNVNLRDFRARDVSWAELKMALQDVADTADLDPTLAAVLQSFGEAIELHIDVATVDERSLPAFLERARPLVEQIASEAGQILGSAPSIAHGAHYAGAKLAYRALDDQPVVVRILAGVPGGAMTPIGAGHTLLVAVGRDHSILLKGTDRSRALDAGLEIVKTPKYIFTGIPVPFEDAERIGAPSVVPRIVSALTTASMLPSGPSLDAATAVANAEGWEYKGKVNLPPGYGAN